MSMACQSSFARDELAAATSGLVQAVHAQDYEAIKEHDHKLRNAAMAVVGTVPMDQEGIAATERTLVSALAAVRAAAAWLEEHMAEAKQTAQKTEHVRLVYTRKSKGGTV